MELAAREKNKIKKQSPWFLFMQLGGIEPQLKRFNALQILGRLPRPRQLTVTDARLAKHCGEDIQSG
jgi:hypothetical protein